MDQAAASRCRVAVTTLLLWALYALSVVLVAFVARWLRHAIPRPLLAVFALLPVLVMLPAFTSGRPRSPSTTPSRFPPGTWPTRA